MLKFALPFASLFLTSLVHADEAASPRVEALIRSLTLEEKAGQLTMASPGPDFDPKIFVNGQVGSVLNYFEPDAIEKVARVGVSSKGIPVLMALDIIHGFRTITPVPVAEAATFDPSLAEAAAELAGREGRAAGVELTFAPVGDIARDARWGRSVEGSGEDTLMGRLFTRARISGFHKGGMATTLKHFAGYGAVDGGRDYDASEISPSRFANIYLPPYRAAIDAGTDTVMTAYVTLDGVPATASHRLMTDLLRRDWGFKGVVMSDWRAVTELQDHGVAADERQAALKAFKAGVDIDMASDIYRKHLPDLVRSGAITEADLNRSVRRVLMLKERLGLFDRKVASAAEAEKTFVTPEARDLARHIATESFVLLKNEGGRLPLKKGLKKIALVGWLADSAGDTIGPHGGDGHDADAVTILEGLRRRAGADAQVVYEPACGALCTDRSAFDQTVKTVEDSDVAIVVLGEARRLMGEAASRANLGLPGLQEELLDRIVKTGKPTILLLFNGRPLALESVAAKVDALMVLWTPGTEGGNAVADVLFGDAVPSGKLPFTFPRHGGQVPMTYDHLPTGRPASAAVHDSTKYQDIGVGPLYPFGYGLSYTRFTYSDLRLEADKIGPEGTVTARFRLRNVGDRDGKEVAQLYVNQPVASISRPVRQLKAFTKIDLKAGEDRDISLAVPVRDLGFVGEDGTWRVEPGRFRLWVGGSSQADLGTEFEVTGETPQVTLQSSAN